jgi:hypothetical protein
MKYSAITDSTHIANVSKECASAVAIRARKRKVIQVA